MKNFKLLSVYYRPGYGDMLGGYHEISLRKNKEGNWIYESSDREIHSDPTVIITYSVSEESIAGFEELLSKKKILSLENRPKGNFFATDYSPWSWSISYETTSFGKTKLNYTSIEEYRMYSGNDFDLLKEMRDCFTSLPGEKILEVTKEK